MAEQRHGSAMRVAEGANEKWLLAPELADPEKFRGYI